MTVRNPLFDFMPYGAPELLTAERPNLLRALALASGLALAAFMLAQALGLALPTQPQIKIAMPMIDLTDLTPPSIHIEEHPATRIAAPSRAKDLAVPVPVADDVAPPIEKTAVEAGSQPAGDGDGATHVPSTSIGPGVLAEQPLPNRKDYVYVDELPVAVKQVEPIYPEFPRTLGIEGRAYVFMLVGKDGRVLRAEVDEKTCDPMFKEAVLTAGRQWVFKPGYVNGHPVPVWVGQAFVFRIHY